MTWVSLCAKLNLDPNTGHKPISKLEKVIKKEQARKRTEEIYGHGTTFGGTLHLSQKQYERGMALSRKMKDMSAW